MRLSIVIVNWNTVTFLKGCLRSIENSTLFSELEVLVIDNASNDGSAEMVVEEFPWVRLFAESKNLGYAAGNNIGFLHARAPYVLTLNSDTVIPDDVFEKSLAVLEECPHYGCLSVKFLNPDGTHQVSVRGFPSFAGILGDITKLDRVFPHSKLGSYRLRDFNYDQSQDAPQPMGTFLLFRRSSLESMRCETAPFDEQFPIFFNEVDLLYRMSQDGFPCWYESSLCITHYGGESTKQVRKNIVWESHLSLIRYFNKHQRGVARILLPLVNGMIWLGALVRTKGVSHGFRP